MKWLKALEKIVKKIALQTARITFNIDNVCSFDSWGRWDPETEAPTPTVFTLGINLTM